MCVEKFCHKLLSKTSIHKHRQQAIVDVTCSILQGKPLSVTQVGRVMMNANQTRSNIRKADRLYSNPHLYHEREMIYRAISETVNKTPHPFILVDGSKLQNSPWYILRASRYAQGRAITLYEYRYRQSEQGSAKLYRRFLKGLSRVLGATVRPILITDAEFRAPWFELVRSVGWDFIGRLRGTANVAIGIDETPSDWRALWDKASAKPRGLGAGSYSKSREVDGYFYLYHTPDKGRHAHTRSGSRSLTIKSCRHKNKAREPWLLISSLHYPANYIVQAYRFRMTIEENFRDTKSGRYGLGLKMTFSRKPQRYAVMLLLAAIASLIAYLIGTVAETKQWQQHFQANSIRKKRVLSRFFLGCEVIYRRQKITMADMRDAVNKIQTETWESFS